MQVPYNLKCELVDEVVLVCAAVIANHEVVADVV